MIKIKITKEYEDISPITFLKKKLKAPFNVIRLLVDKKKILLNEKEISIKNKLNNGDIIEVLDNKIKLKEEKIYKPINLKIKKVYEDNKILILNKLPFIPVQGDGSEKYNIYNHLSYLTKKENIKFLKPVHRLDKNTSGILIIAKNPIVLRELHKLFKEDKIDKTYIALVFGVPKKKNGKVETFLKIRNNEKKKVIIINKKETKFDKYSLSYYKVLNIYKFKYQDKIYKISLVEVNIKTGVTHQIRVHMKHIGTPVLGDRMYGLNNHLEQYLFKKAKAKPRQLLHSEKIKFKFENKNYNIKAVLPYDFTKILKIINDLNSNKKL